jgi:hypothetical protein
MVNLPEFKKTGRNLPYQFSIKSWKHYARKYDCDLYVLTERIFDEDIMNANWHKVYALEILEHNEIAYNKVLIVDTDTIIHPDAPNIFDIVGDKFYAVHNVGSYDWLFRSMEIYSKELFDGFWFPFEQYFNSGFVIVNSNHVEFFKRVIDFYHDNVSKIKFLQQKYGVGTDQPVLNFLAHIDNVDIELLGYEWNMQDMVRKEILRPDLLFTKYGYVYHFNAIPKGFKLVNNSMSEVYQWMNFTYTKLYS